MVVDELHTYRGIFGSHVAQVLRRLQRVAAHHGAEPRWIAASATVANPGELAGALLGQPVAVIGNDGAPRTRRHVALLNPEGSPYTAAARLFRLSVELGLRTIAFTKARKITELMHTWIVEAAPELRDRISSYRSGFLPEERREIEARLFSGELLGVVSTSALEMGIDVGGLDVCILVGYPGSQMSTWQRSGRVGRTREAAVALVAQPDALDQYLVAHPDVFFGRQLEHAVLDPHNEDVLGPHLACAAAEVPLRAPEPWLQEPAVTRAVERLEEEAALLRSESGDAWFAARQRPHRDVSLRSIGSGYTIQLESDGEARPRVVGSIGAGRVFVECHPGAIYLHRGRQYLVTRLDTDELMRQRAARRRPLLHPRDSREGHGGSVSRPRASGRQRPPRHRPRAVTTHVTGLRATTRPRPGPAGHREAWSCPRPTFETSGLWLEIPDEIRSCDRGRRISTPWAESTPSSTRPCRCFRSSRCAIGFDVGGISYLQTSPAQAPIGDLLLRRPCGRRRSWRPASSIGSKPCSTSTSETDRGLRV